MEKTEKSFFRWRCAYYFLITLFMKSLAEIILVFFPINASFDTMRFHQYSFDFYVIAAASIVIVTIVDYIAYRNVQYYVWRLCELVVVLIGAMIFYVLSPSNFMENMVEELHTKEYSVWAEYLEEQGLPVGQKRDNNSFLEPQSWETVSYCENISEDTVFCLSYADCRMEVSVEKYQRQFLEDNKQNDVRQYRENGILHIRAEGQTRDSLERVSELLISEKSVVRLQIESDSGNAQELFSMLSQRLPALFNRYE